MMKNIPLWVWLIFFTFPIVAHASTSVLNIQHWKTHNGADVYFVHEPEIPIVDVAVIFAAGSAYDGTQWGIASFVNSMLNEGTASQTADQIADTLDSVGAIVDGAVDRDMAIVTLRTLTTPKYLKIALSTFSDLLAHSHFPREAFDRVKQQTLASIKQSEQSPSRVAMKAFYRSLYGEYPYAHPTEGTLHTVNTLTPAEIKTFYKRYYVANNADVVIVGDLTRSQAEQVAQHITHALPSGNAATRLTLASEAPNHKEQFVAFPSKQATIILGQLGITLNDPNYFQLVVGNHALGGPGLTSLLFEQVRNQRGLAYGVSSEFSPLEYRGPFFIMLQTRTQKAQQAIKIVQDILQKFIADGPTAAELQSAKQNLIGSFPLLLATNQDILTNVARIAFYHRPLNYLDTYRDRVKAVTRAKVQTAFQQQIHPEQMKMIIVGPKDISNDHSTR